MANYPCNGDVALVFAGMWHEARAEALLGWAKGDRADLFGTIDGVKFDQPVEAALARLSDTMKHLEQTTPETVAGACVLLKLTATMLTDRMLDPEWTLAKGDVLNIINNVRRALDFVDEKLPVGRYVNLQFSEAS